MIDSAWMRRAWALCFLMAALLAGCDGGGGDDEESARETAQAYVDARNDGDAAEVCELYSERLIGTLRTSNCVALVRKQISGTATDLSVVRVTETGDRATATIQARVGGSVANAVAPIELRLSRENGVWRISGFGGRGG
jgi:hypothetical protein